MKLKKEKMERSVFKEKQRITEQLQLSTAQCSTDLWACCVGAQDGKFQILFRVSSSLMLGLVKIDCQI